MKCLLKIFHIDCIHIGGDNPDPQQAGLVWIPVDLEGLVSGQVGSRTRKVGKTAVA